MWNLCNQIREKFCAWSARRDVLLLRDRCGRSSGAGYLANLARDKYGCSASDWRRRAI